jgi:hypothetical protein
MSDGPDYLLELIDKAHALAENERRAAAAYFLKLAADAVIDERSTKHAEVRSFKRRQWRWSVRGRLSR